MTAAPETGLPEMLEPRLRRIVAPNPSSMTYWGTNTYILGDTTLAVIDPGPDNSNHLEAILQSVLPHQRITHILVSHSHLDHSPLAHKLAEHTGAPVYAFGSADAGRSPIMQRLAQRGMAGGGEGIDASFEPTHVVSDGDLLRGDNWELRVIHTPGHLGNHIALAWNDACFTADHVMGWATSLVSPPDGDLTDFMASCRRLRETSWRVFYPGHGAPVEDPNARLEWLINHRMQREEQILEALKAGPDTPTNLARYIYSDTPATLLPAATRNVFAHLVDLSGQGLVTALDGISPEGVFRRTNG